MSNLTGVMTVKVFDNVKALLCSDSVLAAPDFTNPFKLELDACDTSAGALLIRQDTQS